jgi:glycosyltransferase involved in cell wall biosynthesis
MTWPSPWIRELHPPLATLSSGATQDGRSVGIAILARDEARCIERCLDSVAASGFDEVLVVDTGSTDETLQIVDGYRDRGPVRLAQIPWPGSFAQVRNFAVEIITTDWIVFLDADEWLTTSCSAQLRDCLDSLSDIEDVSSLVFAPKIRDVDHRTSANDVPRIFRTDSEIRYKGLVHEYVVIAGSVEKPVGLVGLDIEFLHDGYNPAVARAKDKRKRNLVLLDAARAADPGDPRWPCFRIRDAGLEITSAEIVELCTALHDMVGGDTGTGDRQCALDYYRIAFGFACQALVAMNDWNVVNHLCDQLDAVERHHNPDAHYFRSMSWVNEGIVTNRDLLGTIRIRNDEDLVATSTIDRAGRHLDALIGLLLARCRSAAEARRYLDLCAPWTDGFFEGSALRGGVRL